MFVDIRYVKRVLMAFDLDGSRLESPALPKSFFWKEWNPSLVSEHARVVFEAFSVDVDARVFPTYRQLAACEHLVDATSSASSFAPEATWAICARGFPTPDKDECGAECCAAVQCLWKRESIGEIKNVSVRPSARRRGLGKALVLKALESFERIGAKRIVLEVTAENVGALLMYSSIGFRPLRYFYAESFVERSR